MPSQTSGKLPKRLISPEITRTETISLPAEAGVVSIAMVEVAYQLEGVHSGDSTTTPSRETAGRGQTRTSSEYTEDEGSGDSKKTSRGAMHKASLAVLAAIIAQSGQMGEGRSAPALAAGSDATETTSKAPRYRRVRSYRRGSGRHAAGRSNLQKRREKSRPVANLHGTQKRFKQKASGDQPEVGQLSPHDSTLQNDNHPGSQATGYQRCFHDKDRSQRLLLASSSAARAPALPQFSMAGPELQLQLSPIRSFGQPLVRNEIVQTSDCAAPARRFLAGNIPGRLGHSGQVDSGLQDSHSEDLGASFSVGSDRQQGEVYPGDVTTNRVPGVYSGLGKDDGLGTKEQAEECKHRDQEISEPTQSVSQTCSFGDREDRGVVGSPVSNQGAHGSHPAMEVSASSSWMGSRGNDSSGGERRSTVVAGAPQRNEWSFAVTYERGHHSGHRRFGLRMGSMDPTQQRRETGLRWLFSGGRPPSPHQLQRVVGGPHHAAQLQTGVAGQGGANIHRQYNSNVLCQSSGREKVSSNQASDRNMANSGLNQGQDCGGVCAGRGQHSSGQGIEENASTERHAVEPSDIQASGGHVGAALNRSVCNNRKYSSAEVCQLEAESGSDMGRCNESQLGQRKRMGSSSVQSIDEGPGKSAKRGVDDHPRRAMVASTAMVSATTGHDRGSSFIAECNTSAGRANESSISNVADTRMESIRKQLKDQGFNDSVFEVVKEAWAKGTISQYEQLWQVWVKYCTENGRSVFCVDNLFFVNWLAKLVQDGTGQSMAEKYKAVVSSTIELVTGVCLGKSKLAIKSMEAAKSMNRPKQTRVSLIFDLTPVIKSLEPLPDEDDRLKDFKQSTERMIQLFKVFFGWRSDDLKGATVTWGVRFTENGVYLRFFDAKNRKNKWSAWVFAPQLINDFAHLCIPSAVRRVQNLADGLSAVKITVRDTNNNEAEDFPLFAWYNAKEEQLWPLEGTTIGNKTKPLLPQGFTPHQFRHAVASQLVDMGVPHKLVAEHLQIEEKTVQKTYATKVERTVAIPTQCVQNASDLVHKLLVPYIHDRGECRCSRVLAFKSSVDESTPKR